MSSQPPPDANLQIEPTGITVDSIVVAPESNDTVTVLSVELELKQVELEKSQLLNRELQDNILRRGNWGNRIFWLMLGWLIAVLAIVILQGFGILGFHLDDSIIISFIGTTTVDVLSLGYIVAKYLFPMPK